jgi:hypothetical protein
MRVYPWAAAAPASRQLVAAVSRVQRRCRIPAVQGRSTLVLFELKSTDIIDQHRYQERHWRACVRTDYARKDGYAVGRPDVAVADAPLFLGIKKGARDERLKACLSGPDGL